MENDHQSKRRPKRLPLLIGLATRMTRRVLVNELKVRQIEIETGARSPDDNSGLPLPQTVAEIPLFVRRALGLPSRNPRHQR